MPVSKYVNWSSVTFIATLAGLAMPLWLWFADLNSRSLLLSVVSQTALTSEEAGTIKGLQVFVDGVPIVAPTLSVIQVSNDGNKPIPSADYEGPLEVRFGEGTKVIRAEVTATSPRDIEAKLSSEALIVRIEPLLLNPDDSVTLSLLTSGKPPTFQPRARVAGVSTIKLSDGTAKTPPSRIALLALLASVLFFAASDIANSSFVGGQPFIVVRKRAALLIMTACGLAGMAFFFVFFQAAGFEGLAWLAGLMFTVVVAGALLAAVLNRGANELAKPKSAA